VRPYVEVVRAHSDASFQSAIAAYQLAEGLPIDPSRLYYEISLRWVFWYVGVPAVILGTIGAAILVRRCTRGQLPTWTLPLAAFAWAIFSTLYRPAITPDQPWASRRLVPAVLPGFVLLAVWAVSWGVGKLRERGFGEFGRGVVVACCAAALVIPAAITSFGLTLQGGLSADGLALKKTYQGEITAVHSLCAALPRNASVIFIDSGQSKAGFELAEVVRGMCGLPTAIAEFGSAQPLMPAIRKIWAAGRQPVLLDGDAAGLDGVGGPPRNVMRLHTSIDGNTLTAAPTKTTPFNLTVWMTEPSP
jgi:hypothetical protein